MAAKRLPGDMVESLTYTDAYMRELGKLKEQQDLSKKNTGKDKYKDKKNWISIINCFYQYIFIYKSIYYHFLITPYSNFKLLDLSRNRDQDFWIKYKYSNKWQ